MKSGYDQFFTKAKQNAQDSDSPTYRLRKNISIKREEKNKNKKSFPIFSIFCFGLCLVAAFLLIEKFDSIETYISKIEIGLGTAEAQQSTEATAPTPEVKNAEATEPLKIEAKPTEDNADYLFKLAERKKELDAREEELNKKATEIAEQKVEIEAKLKQLEESREKISSLLKERISTDGQKVDNLVQMYSNMKPSQAAKVFETLDEDLVIEILSRMKKKNAAEVLNLIKTDKAQMFSERYAGYRKPAQVPEVPAANDVNKENDKKMETKP